ncbi:undecaprenyl-diphosphate phosphatase [Aquibacillus koreensis]|uniref:Undecaprenyl-diphosphatase n=1 Tax=Aquibacillus koreensis TaxID=279446 RepID=A0A9X3WRC0_9BACI|nr:undecaprenyl-diphosphate phosphatase [Aquibacillus koreensis]MCT2535446.1 undecaprenyl-diphosphate phosphatase [Aquibacillus koreensis]MDC3422281.1 undecaprenyl-diphosphate phosphatase [Aquibacillus koreensis]
MDIMLLLKAVILGLVEGLTEFAPVSSTGHMIIVDDMWLKSEEFLTKYVANTFKVVIQLGSILAVIIIFRQRFIDMLLVGKQKKDKPRLKLTQVIVGLIPAGVLGVLFEDYIDEHLFSIETVLIGLVVGAILMIFADYVSKKNKGIKVETVDQISYKQALTIGFIQCLSLWPGFSRSGSTISGGVILGMSHRAAADFTFIMAVPIMLGASFLSLIKNLEYFSIDMMPFFIVGFISAFIFALISIQFFLKLINKIKLVPFAIYRIILVIVICLVYF